MKYTRIQMLRKPETLRDVLKSLKEKEEKSIKIFVDLFE